MAIHTDSVQRHRQACYSQYVLLQDDMRKMQNWKVTLRKIETHEKVERPEGPCRNPCRNPWKAYSSDAQAASWLLEFTTICTSFWTARTASGTAGHAHNAPCLALPHTLRPTYRWRLTMPHASYRRRHRPQSRPPSRPRPHCLV